MVSASWNEGINKLLYNEALICIAPTANLCKSDTKRFIWYLSRLIWSMKLSFSYKGIKFYYHADSGACGLWDLYWVIIRKSNLQYKHN